MLMFNIIMSCHTIAGNMDHCFYLKKHDQEEKGFPPLKGCKKA